jgi:phosphatidylserine decarboxylase
LFLLLLALNIIVLAWWSPSSATETAVLMLSLLIFILVLQFFRKPAVHSPIDTQHILAPANGKVVVIEPTITDEFIEEERIQFSIFMSPIDVHNNRNPVTGTIKYFAYHPGKYLVAWHPKSSTLNERTTLVIEMADGLLLPLRQIAGALARRIKCYVKEGDPVVQGEEFGFIKFGSRVDMFLPLNSEILIKTGTHVKAGKTIIARLPEEQ